MPSTWQRAQVRAWQDVVLVEQKEYSGEEGGWRLRVHALLAAVHAAGKVLWLDPGMVLQVTLPLRHPCFPPPLAPRAPFGLPSNVRARAADEGSCHLHWRRRATRVGERSMRGLGGLSVG